MSRESKTTRRGLPTPGVAVPPDRRFRRAAAPAVRRRRSARTPWTMVRWAISAGLLLLGGTWGGQQLMASDLFLVRDITLRGNRHLSPGEAELLLEGLRSENVFLVDFERYRQRLMDSAWVEHVSLSRVLPSTIVVDIVERTPIAAARLNQQLYLVDRTGNIVDEYRAEHSAFDLPVVDGLLDPDQTGDSPADPERAGLVAALFDALATRPDLQSRVSQIDAADPLDLVVMFDDDPTWLHLGRESFVERLQRYLDLRPALLDRVGAIDYVDLKFDERVYVRGQGPQKTRSGATK